MYQEESRRTITYYYVLLTLARLTSNEKGYKDVPRRTNTYQQVKRRTKTNKENDTQFLPTSTKTYKEVLRRTITDPMGDTFLYLSAFKK